MAKSRDSRKETKKAPAKKATKGAASAPAKETKKIPTWKSET